jgi:putative endonuclease
MRHWAETIAKQHLLLKGYALLAENYSIRGGEIDLIMQDREVIVFVEVRQRLKETHGTAAESITPHKLQRLQKTALGFLVEHYKRDDLALRFDAVLILGNKKSYRLEHLENIIG